MSNILSMSEFMKVGSRVFRDFKTLQNEGYEVVYVGHYGSYNYNLQYEDSDIDTKAIVLPKFNDFILNKKPFSHTKVLDTPKEEHIDIKDIRNMFDCFKKQNINFLEILFSKFSFINEEYKELFKPMIENRERIARYNNYAGVNCIVGLILQKHKALEHPYPTIKDRVEKYGFDTKQLHHILRCTELLERYIEGEPYEDILISKDPEYLVNVKREGFYTLQQAREIADESLLIAKKMKDDYYKNVPVKIDKEAEDIMQDVLLKILKHSFKKRLQGGE